MVRRPLAARLLHQSPNRLSLSALPRTWRDRRAETGRPSCGPPSDLRPAANVELATWIVERIHPFAQDVGSVVPEGFASYARVFHPAERRSSDGTLVPVSWAAIAEANGRTPHPEMQFEGLVDMWPYTAESDHGQPPLWDQWPEEGSLPYEQAARLVDLLSPHTGTPHRCWFAVWEGFGGLRTDAARAPAFDLPDRRYHLLQGLLALLVESCCDPPGYQSANLCWPDDRAWCMATEIDFTWTYIGGSRECISAVLHDPVIEALPAELDHGITVFSDPINPVPPRPQ